MPTSLAQEAVWLGIGTSLLILRQSLKELLMFADFVLSWPDQV